jgi:hypothetical protein
MTLEEYATEYLYREIKLIEFSEERMNALPELTVYEKAIIFKYSEDGYEDLNEKLRLSKGKDISDFGILLDECLSKLPDYQGIVYRGADFPKYKIDQYVIKLSNNESITEHAFLSTSLIANEAYKYGMTTLRIFSKKGKTIGSISKYQNEKEILFRFNTKFEIIAIDFDKENHKYLISLEEL